MFHVPDFIDGSTKVSFLVAKAGNFDGILYIEE